MKKKFINGLLMAALFVGFTSSLVSCKDYDDEKIIDLTGILGDRIDALENALAVQKADLQKQIDALTALQAQCKADCQAAQAKLQAQIDLCLLKSEFFTEMTNLRNELDGKYYTQTVLDQKFNEINAKFNNIYTIPEIKALFNDYYTKAEIDAMLATIRTDIEACVTKTGLNQSILDLLGSSKTTLTEAFEDVIAAYNTKKGIIDETAIKALISAEIVKVNLAIKTAQDLAQEAKDLAVANGTKIDGLTTRVESLENSVKTITPKLDKVIEDAAAAMAKAVANETNITNLTNQYNELNGTVTALQTTVTSNYNTLKELIDTNIANISALTNTVQQNKEAAEQLIQALDDKIQASITAIESNVSNMQTSIQTIETNVSTLETTAETLRTDVNKNASDIEALIKKYDNIAAKFISGIEINGTYNPLYGEMALPLDVRSNLLVVFHGITDDLGLQFPSRSQNYRTHAGELYNNFDQSDLDILGFASTRDIPGFIELDGNESFVAKTFINEDGDTDVKEGNAGTIYMTVNPTDRDFTGTEFTLINSANVEVPVEIGDLAKSDHVLSFGLTRSAVSGEQSPNGFYEAQVTVQPENIEAIGPRMSLESIQDVIVDVQDGGALSVSKIMNAINNNISDILDANAVKATWTDDLGQKSVVSQYALGVTSIKPFSFGAYIPLQDMFDSGMVRIEDFIHNMVKYCFDALPDLSFDQFEIGNFELDDMTNFIATFRLNLSPRYIVSSGPKTVSITVPTFTLTGTKGEKVVVKNSSPNVTVSIDGANACITIKVYIGDVIKWMGKYDSEPEANIKAQLKNFLSDVNTFLKEITNINFDGATDKISNKIFSYFEKFGKKIRRFLNTTRLLEPIIMANTTDGLVRLSEVSNYPTKAKGTLTTLIPTSYNAEILAPAFKKFVAITNVSKEGKDAKNDKDADCLNVLKKMNQAEGYVKVIDGGYDSVLPFAPEAGYTYEILYSAVDYFGKIISKKFYVSVQ